MGRTPEFPGPSKFFQPAVGRRRRAERWALARRAEDLMPLLRILAGPDGIDTECRPFVLKDPEQVDLSKVEVLSVPSNGVRDLYASSMSRTSNRPALKKVEAARTRMAVLTRKAAFRAMAESTKLYFIADQIPFSDESILRV